jgi:hypothetical protein
MGRLLLALAGLADIAMTISSKRDHKHLRGPERRHDHTGKQQHQQHKCKLGAPPQDTTTTRHHHHKTPPPQEIRHKMQLSAELASACCEQ